MMRHLISIKDLDGDDVDRIVSRASVLRSDAGFRRPGHSVVGLVFVEPSLRTRSGYAVAAHRLGWGAVEVLEARSGPKSMPESLEDTLRTISGMVDTVVARIDRPADSAWVDKWCVSPYVNAGDTGPRAEHPTQALIDIFSIEHERGAISTLTLGICGDLRMRVVRSLIALLERRQPRRLVLITAPEIGEVNLPRSLAEKVEIRTMSDLAGIDVLYVAGMPHGAFSEEGRAVLRVDSAALERLPNDAVVLSPLPLLDEMTADARVDPRVRMFHQSDSAVWIRMAVLEMLVSDRWSV